MGGDRSVRVTPSAMSYAVSAKFAPHFSAWGPDARACTDVAEAERYCRELTFGHYENFPVTSIALPARLKQPMANVYAFCRWADDLGDEIEGAEQSLELLDWWEQELDRCFTGEATHPVFVALEKSIGEHRLERRPFADLISAFKQDQTATVYQSDDDLRDYCRRSANPVGRIVLRLFEHDTDDRVALSDSVCTGLQLINFWQDVARDADIGRTYLPADRRAEFGYTDDMLAARATNPQFVALVRSLVDDAKRALSQGEELAATLRGRLRVVIEMFYRGGLTVARRIEAGGYDSWHHRPEVRKRDVAKILLASSWATVVRSKPAGSAR